MAGCVESCGASVSAVGCLWMSTVASRNPTCVVPTVPGELARAVTGASAVCVVCYVLPVAFHLRLYYRRKPISHRNFSFGGGREYQPSQGYSLRRASTRAFGSRPLPRPADDGGAACDVHTSHGGDGAYVGDAVRLHTDADQGATEVAVSQQGTDSDAEVASPTGGAADSLAASIASLGAWAHGGAEAAPGDGVAEPLLAGCDRSLETHAAAQLDAAQISGPGRAVSGPHGGYPAAFDAVETAAWVSHIKHVLVPISVLLFGTLSSLAALIVAIHKLMQGS